MTDYVDDCIFCRIAARKIPAEMVFEDDRVVAFRDINPKAPVHVLIAPRRHLDSAAELGPGDGELLSAIFGAVRAVADKEGLASYRVGTNVGAEAGQSVFHLHFHLMGGRPLDWRLG